MVFEDVGVADGAVCVREPDAAAWTCGIQNSVLHLAEARDKASAKVSLTATKTNVIDTTDTKTMASVD